MKKRQKQVVQTILFFSIGIALVYFQIDQLTPNQKQSVIQSIKQANAFWITAAMIIALLSHATRALRWKMLINTTKDKVSFINSFYAVMIGYLANGFLPRFGEVIRCGVLGRKENVQFEKLIGTVLAERLFDLIVMLLIVFLTILVQYQFLYQFLNEELFQPSAKYIHQHQLKFLLFFGSIAVVGLLVYFFMGQILRSISGTIASKWQSVKQSFSEGFSTILQLKNKALFLGYTLLMWVCYFFMSYFVFFSLKETKFLGIDAGLSVLTSGSLALVIPTPGGLGSYHQFVSKTLQLYDVSQSTGISLSWLIWSANFGIILLFGLLSLLLISNLFKKNKQ